MDVENETRLQFMHRAPCMLGKMHEKCESSVSAAFALFERFCKMLCIFFTVQLKKKNLQKMYFFFRREIL